MWPSFFVLACLNLSPVESLQSLAVLETLREQVQKLNEMVSSSKAQEAQLNEISTILESNLKRVDSLIKPFEESESLHRALIELEEERQVIEKKQRKSSDFENQLRNLQLKLNVESPEEAVLLDLDDSLLKINRSEIERIAQIESTLASQNQLSVKEQSALHQWRSLVRLSLQMERLLGRVEKVNKELEYQRLQQRFSTKKEEEFFGEAIDSLGFLLGDGDR